MPEIRKYDKFYIILREELTGYSYGDRKPSGNCSVEIRDNRGKATIYVQGLKPQSGGNIYKSYIISVDDKKAVGVSMGLLPIDPKGKGVKVWEFNPRNVGNSGLDIDMFNVIAVMVKNVTNPTDDVIVAMCGYRNNEKLWKHLFKEFKEDENTNSARSLEIKKPQKNSESTYRENSNVSLPIIAPDSKNVSAPVVEQDNISPVSVVEQDNTSPVSVVEQDNTSPVSVVEQDNISPVSVVEQDNVSQVSVIQAENNIDTVPIVPLEGTLPVKSPATSCEENNIHIDPLVSAEEASKSDELSDDIKNAEITAESLQGSSSNASPSDRCPDTFRGKKDNSNGTAQKCNEEQFEDLLTRFIKKTGNNSNVFNSVNNIKKDTASSENNGSKSSSETVKDPHDAFSSMTNSFFNEFKELINYKLFDNNDSMPANSVDNNDSISTNSVDNNAMNVKPFDDLDYMFINNAKMVPFVNKINGVAWIRIFLDELSVLSFNVYNFINNPFLVYAFKMYKHLILGRVSVNNHFRYLLGVPGIYDPSLKLEASRIGFTQFKCCDDKVPGEGDAGYWLMDIL